VVWVISRRHGRFCSKRVRNIGGSVGISLVTTLEARLMQRHQLRLIENLSLVNPRYLAMLRRLPATQRIRGSDTVGR
jgi:hypothetical protein